MTEHYPGHAPHLDERLVERAARAILSWRRILIASHRNPDGDALGASLGLALALSSSGREVLVANADPPAEPRLAGAAGFPLFAGLAAIPGAGSVVTWDQVGDAAFDGVVMVDCGSPDRLHHDPAVPGSVLAKAGGLVVIDHHLTSVQSPARPTRPEADAAIRVVDPTRASSAELVLLVLDAAGLPVDQAAATALLTGVATDTKGFLRESADARAFAVAARLRALGGEVVVAADILERHNAGFLRLAGSVLSRVVYVSDGAGNAAAGIVAAIPRSLLVDCGADDADVERLTSILSGTRDARVVALLQDKGGEIRGSLRTQAPVDAVAIARRFGGGGHTRRAGFRVSGASLEDVEAEVVGVVRDRVATAFNCV